METKCCCDLKVHPEDIQSNTQLLGAGSTAGTSGRHQLIIEACHLLEMNITVVDGEDTIHPVEDYTPTLVKVFTTDDPDDASVDEDKFTLVAAPALGSKASTPAQAEGLYFPSGIFVEIIQGTAGSDTNDDTQILINTLYVLREAYTPAFPAPHDWKLNAWHCWRGDDDLYDNYNLGLNNDEWANDPSDGTSGFPASPID